MKFLNSGSGSGWRLLGSGANKGALAGKGAAAAKTYTPYELVSSKAGFLSRFAQLPFIKVAGKALGWIGWIWTFADIAKSIFGQDKDHPGYFFSLLNSMVPPAVIAMLTTEDRINHSALLRVCLNGAELLSDDSEDGEQNQGAVAAFLALPEYLARFPFGSECFTQEQRSTIMKQSLAAFMGIGPDNAGVSNDDLAEMFAGMNEAEDTPIIISRALDFLCYVLAANADDGDGSDMANFLASDGRAIFSGPQHAASEVKEFVSTSPLSANDVPHGPVDNLFSIIGLDFLNDKSPR